MDVTKLKRDTKKVLGVLKEKGDSLIATKPIKIIFPKRFTEKKLAIVENDITVVGLHALVVEDKYYAVNNTLAMMILGPSTSNTFEVNEETQMELSFEAGDVVYSTLNLVKDSGLPFTVFDEIIAKGKVPWFIDYMEMSRLFDTSIKHASFNLGANNAVLELITSAITRRIDDRSKYVRQTLKTEADLFKEVFFVPMRSVQYGATNTTAKIAGGAYFEEGLSSALVNPAERSEGIETLLRE